MFLVKHVVFSNTVYYRVAKALFGDLDMKSVRYSSIRVSRVLVVRENQIVLVKSAKTNAWELPGGKCEHKENYLSAAVRELREETNLTGTVFPQYVLCHRVVYGEREVRHMIHCYLHVSAVDEKLHVNDTTEIIDALWFTFEQLPKNLSAETRLFVDSYKNNLAANTRIEIFTKLD